MEKWELPEGWEWKAVGSVARIVNGFGFPKMYQRRSNLPYPFIKVSDMNLPGNELYMGSAANTVDDQILREIGARVYPKGTIIFPKIGGAIATNKKRILEVASTFDNNVMGIVPNDANLDLRWCFYFLNTLDLMALANQGPIPSISQGAVNEIEIPIPYPDDPALSLEIQRRIVARLDALMEELKETRKLQQGILGDVSRLMQSFIENVFGENSYQTIPLGDNSVASIIAGQHVDSKDYSNQPVGTPYITGPADFGEKYPIITRWTTKPKIFCQPGDVLFTVKGSGVGRVNCSPIEDRTCIGRQLMAIRPNHERVLTDYLFFVLMGRFKEFQGLRQGAAIPGIRKEQVEAIRIQLPSIEQQQHIVAYLSRVQTEIIEMQKEELESVRLLDQVEQAFLGQAFRGEL